MSKVTHEGKFELEQSHYIFLLCMYQGFDTQALSHWDEPYRNSIEDYLVHTELLDENREELTDYGDQLISELLETNYVLLDVKELRRL